METLWQDLSYGWRTLTKNPGFALVAILSLAIGIGASSAIFSVTNAVLLRPLPYQDADRLMILWSRSPGLNVAQDWFSPGQYLDVKTQNQVFEQTAITIGASFNLTGQGGPEHVDGARVSSSFFSLFGAQPALGRVLLPEEDEPGKPLTVLLSHQFWQRRFSGDKNIIGQTISLNGNNFSVVGVLPPGFSVSNEVMPAVNSIETADVFLPLPMNESARANRGNEDFNIFGKLKPGVSVAQAQADMDLIAGRMKQQFPENYPPTGGLTISVVPLLAQVVGDVGQTLPLLLGAVGFVLLIACANVANLLLARAAIRQKEIAVRAAVGASRGRILRQLLTESVLLSLLGGFLGLLIAFGAVAALRQFGPTNLPRLAEVGVDGRVIAFTCLLALLTGIVFGLAPALRTSRVDLHETLKEGGRNAEAAAGRSHHRLRRLLVVAEVALSLVLLIGAGLLIRSYQRILAAHPGFNPVNVFSLRLTLPATKYPNQEAVAAFYKRALDRLKALPGVEAAATSYSLPMSTVAFAWEPIGVEGYVPKNAQDTIMSNVRIVSPGYFPAMGVPLVHGRLFDDRDKKGQPETVIINEAFAERFWPNQDPLGQRMQRGKSGVWRTVIGVIRDTKQFSLEKEPPIGVYYPAEQIIPRSMYLVIRTTNAPEQSSSAILKEIQTVDPELPAFDVKTMEQRLRGSLARRRFAMVLLGAFAGIALLLAVIGIYGVMTYWVNQRTNEIGIRMALGAQPANIRQLVLRQAALLVTLGIVFGVAGAIALTRVMANQLFGISATDSVTFGLLSLLLAAIALLASWLPARRAAKVDPMIALRHE
ncbi:MAG: ABC transporter permease [Acidobacteria bacterium]|nr:ABC transporter permease [Acidobacteriota bacterium]